MIQNRDESRRIEDDSTGKKKRNIGGNNRKNLRGTKIYHRNKEKEKGKGNEEKIRKKGQRSALITSAPEKEWLQVSICVTKIRLFFHLFRTSFFFRFTLSKQKRKEK